MIAIHFVPLLFSKKRLKSCYFLHSYLFGFAVSHSLTLLCLLGALIHPLQSNARPFILICHEQTPVEECTDFLTKTPEAISYISFIELVTGTATRDLTQRIFDLQTHHQDLSQSIEQVKDEENDDLNTLINETSQGFLSNIKKSLLVKLMILSSSPPNTLNTVTKATTLPNFKNQTEEALTSNQSSNFDHSQQIRILTEGVIKHPGTLPLSVALHRQDDQLYINGRLIKSEHIKTIRVYPHLYYHISYLSNTYRPYFQWSRGDQILPFPKQTLVSGDCLNPYWEKGVTETTESTRGLFPSACINVISRPRANASMLLDQEPPKDLPKSISIKESPHHYWAEHPLIAIGASLFVFNFFQKELQKTSKTQFTWKMSF